MKKPPSSFLVLLLAAVSTLLGITGLQAQVQTLFLETHGVFQNTGAYWYQGFTLSKQQTFVLRMTCDYSADAAVVPEAQLGNFINNRGFTGYGTFDNQYGTKTITLGPGKYYLGVRSQTSSANTYRLELDYDISVPADASNTYSFVDNYIQGTNYVAANDGKLWHGFTIQAGFRYFVDGCNTGLSTYVIPASELTAFKAGGTFKYYTAYSGTDNALPGLDEISLPPGSYYLAFVNENSIKKPVTYSLERWRKTATQSRTLDMSGKVAWKTSGQKVNIRVGKVANLSNTGKSGSLRLRLWALRSPYTGGSISGFVMGTRTLSPLTGGYAYTKIKGHVAFRRPPAGKYYTAVTLEEFTTSGWVVRDYTSFSGKNQF